MKFSDKLTSGIERLWPNVARNGVASQVSDYHHPSLFSNPDYAFYANDGNFSTNLNEEARCAITTNVFGAWWKVDLLDLYLVIKVAVTTRHKQW